VPELGVRVHRHGRAHPGCRAGHRDPDHVPLTFGTSTFVPTETLPGWPQAFTDVNPMTHLIGTLRALLLDAPMGHHLLWTAVSMAVLLVVFVPLVRRASALAFVTVRPPISTSWPASSQCGTSASAMRPAPRTPIITDRPPSRD
jgi:hypothetical protein